MVKKKLIDFRSKEIHKFITYGNKGCKIFLMI